jgi:pyruvate/2-oxoglutarate dehydrogenase complex dihydrolipoamide acyltransferase (E2) component
MEIKSFELRTPDLGDAEKIELLKWYVSENDSIKEGDEILELITDKAAFPVESPYSGKLKSKLANDGEIVSKNQILGILELN